MQAYRETVARRGLRGVGTLARALREGRARARAAAEPLPVDGERLRRLLAGTGAEARLLDIPVDRPPWTPTGLRVEPGEVVGWLAWGSVHLAARLGISAPPRAVVGARIGAGPALRSTADTFTRVAGDAGELQLGSLFPGEPREDGTVVTDRIPYRMMSGRLSAIVVRWAPGTSPREALAGVAARDASGLCAAEAERLASPPRPPAGWDEHPLAAAAGVYRRSPAGIAAQIREPVGIIRRPAGMALSETLRLRWAWRLEELPARLPEDTPLTHDHLSVALEFDDGRDLAWQWSCGLPEGFSYRCPLDHWRHREAHVVVRSGGDGLGRWLDEERPVLADHRAALGGPTPARVVRAWLISVAAFQGGEGRGEFARIELVDGGRTLRVL
ncbi:MAG: hypothetical protein BroJett022_00480 [Actinomycetes bacterium]|nr:MAG: hypothetical protein BroJett022_00480 [Actinomycetes bacterium]